MSTNPKSKSDLQSSTFSIGNKILRMIWSFTYVFLFRYSPAPLFRWRSFLLKAFGAKIGQRARVYPSAKIWLPSNLSMSPKSTLGPGVDVYNQGHISIGKNAIISQGAHLCASTHDYNDPLHPLILGPIQIAENVWVCAEAFIGPNVIVAEGTVVGARAVLTKNTEANDIYAGNPAVFIKKRKWDEK